MDNLVQRPLYDFLEHISDGFVALDKNWRYIYVNQRGADMLGRRSEDLIGKHIWTEFPEGIDQPFYKAYHKAMEEQVSILIEEYYPPWDRWFENRIYPFPEGIAIFYTEITQKKKAEKALQEKENVLRLFVEYSPASIAMFDRDMRYIVASRRYLADYHLGEQDIVGRSHYEVFPEMPERWKEIHRRCLAGAIERCDQDPFPRADGRLDWVRWEIRPWYETTGEIGGIILFSEVITERIEAEEIIRERERQLSTLIGNLPGVVYRCRNNEDYTAEFVSEGIANLTGYPADDFRQHRQNLGKIIHPDDQERVWMEIQSALQRNERYELTYRIHTARGEEKWVWERGQGIYDAAGQLEVLEGFVTDITDRKAAETALREAAEAISFIVEGTETGLWDWDLTTNRVRYSREWKQMLGYKEDEVADHLDEWRLLTHPDDIEPTLAKVNAYLQRPQGTLDAEFRMRHKSGEYRWIFSRATAYLGDDGRPMRLLGLHINITDRKRAEEALRESEERWHHVLDGLGPHMFVGLMDVHGVVLLANRPALVAAGLRLEDVQGQPVADTYWWSYSMEVQTRLRAAVERAARGEPVRYDERIRVAEGQFIWIDFSIQPLQDETGHVSFLIPSAQVITERKQAEEEIRTASEELRALNRIIMSCSNILDTKEILNKVMEEALRITGLEGSTVCLVGPDETLHLAAQRGASEATIQDLTTHAIKIGDCLCGTCARDHTSLILPDRESVLQFATRESARGEDFRFHAAFPLMAAGKCTGVLCIFTRTDRQPTDRSLKLLEIITAQVALAIDNARLYEETAQHAVKLEERVRERTAELAQANVKLKELDHLKSMFIASMSHELRTPLNSIIGFTGIILMGMSGELSREQRKQLSIVQKSARHLLELITDVIDVSKIEAEKVELFLKEFDLSSLLREVMESFTHAAAEKGLKLTLNAPEKLVVRSDERRIKQVLNNLLSNAIKFTTEGGVETTALEAGGRITIRVRDTGIGIKSGDQEHLFKAFSKFIQEGVPRQEGTGLGLYLSRKIAGLLGGELRAESEFGKGSTFTFEFPRIL